MCIFALILGIFGTLMALIGIVFSLMRVYNTEPLSTFIILIFITIFVLIGAGIGIYGIVRIIKRNPEILECNMRQQRLRDAIIRAYDLQHLADSAVSIVASLLVFRDFDDDEPVISITSSDEMILEWHGHEMQIESALDIMERIGYIQPTDFEATYGRW